MALLFIHENVLICRCTLVVEGPVSRRRYASEQWGRIAGELSMQTWKLTFREFSHESRQAQLS